MEQQNPQREYKDRLFRFIFSYKENALSLYNAINGTDYDDPDALTFVTLDDVIYMNMKNDLAFILSPDMNLYEHQSSYNPNMPLRGLFYLAREYEKYVEQHNINIYGSTLKKLPTPKYVVFYNGLQEMPDKTELRLSDAFDRPEESCIELKAVVYNINIGRNQELVTRCNRLNEYVRFVGCGRRFIDSGMDSKTAVTAAVNKCIDEGIMSDILREHKAEVIGMVLNEWDSEKMRRLDREEGREEGRIEGRDATLLEAIRNLVKNVGMTVEQAVKALDIPADQQAKYISLL